MGVFFYQQGCVRAKYSNIKKYFIELGCLVHAGKIAAPFFRGHTSCGPSQEKGPKSSKTNSSIVFSTMDYTIVECHLHNASVPWPTKKHTKANCSSPRTSFLSWMKETHRGLDVNSVVRIISKSLI